MTTPRQALPATLLLCLLAACSGQRAFTRGEYEDPNKIEMLSDQFNQNDLQLIAKKMVDSLSGSRAFARIEGRPVIFVGKMKNSTSEHIDMRSLADKMEVALGRTDKFAFLDKAAREELAQEYEYQGSGYVNAASAKAKGQQTGADYMMTGEISSITQEVGRDKLVYYKMTSKLHNVRTGIVEWSDEKELTKKFEKRGVSW